MKMEKYFNWYGFIMVMVILIPNIVFAMTCKDGFVNKYQKLAVLFAPCHILISVRNAV